MRDAISSWLTSQERAQMSPTKNLDCKSRSSTALIEYVAPPLQFADDSYLMRMRNTTLDQPISERWSTWRDSNEAGRQLYNAASGRVAQKNSSAHFSQTRISMIQAGSMSGQLIQESLQTSLCSEQLKEKEQILLQYLQP